MPDLEIEIKRLIVECLALEDVSPDEIDSDEALFGTTGLGLDSIDALELGVALRKRFGIKVDKVDDEVKQHFATVRSLARFIQTQGRS
ncbi:MAG: acyl carrier protein [Proteobacteria bacterium]|nr:acyl carrier protein [Pseudomonadota bacterium]